MWLLSQCKLFIFVLHLEFAALFFHHFLCLEFLQARNQLSVPVGCIPGVNQCGFVLDHYHSERTASKGPTIRNHGRGGGVTIPEKKFLQRKILKNKNPASSPPSKKRPTISKKKKSCRQLGLKKKNRALEIFCPPSRDFKWSAPKYKNQSATKFKICTHGSGFHNYCDLRVFFYSAWLGLHHSVCRKPRE